MGSPSGGDISTVGKHLTDANVLIIGLKKHFNCQSFKFSGLFYLACNSSVVHIFIKPQLIGFCKQTSLLCMVDKYDDFSLRTTHKNATSGHSTNIGGSLLGESASRKIPFKMINYPK